MENNLHILFLKLHKHLNRYIENLKVEDIDGCRKLTELQIDKMDDAIQERHELAFYVLIQENENVVDNAFLNWMPCYAMLDLRQL